MLKIRDFSNMKYIYLFSIIIAIIKNIECSADEQNIGKILIKDGLYLAKEFKILLTNKNNPRSDSKSKICVVSSTQDYENNCKPFIKIYYDKWLIHTSNETTINEIIDKINQQKDGYANNIDGIVVPINIDISKYAEVNIPILLVSFSDFLQISSYDFKNENENYFGFVKYDQSNIYQPWTFLKFCSFIGFVLTLIITFLWHYNTFKKYRRHSNALQKTLSALPYITVLYSLCLYNYFKTLENMDSSDDNNLSMRSYLITILITLNSIYRTIFWFLIIIVAYGWQIYKFNLTRLEMRKFIGIYIFIYLTVCFDQIVDSIINRTIYGFKFSQIKNFLIYLIFTITILTKCLSSLKVLNAKLSYARSLAVEFVPGLELKASLIKYHMFFSLLYTVLYIPMTIVLTITVKMIDMDNIIFISNYLLDLLIMCCFLFVHRSREFPVYYTLDLYSNDDDQEPNADIKVLSVKIPRLAKLKTANDNDFSGFIDKPNKNQKKDLLENNLRRPLVIINPIFDSEVYQSEVEPNSYNSRQNAINNNENLNIGNLVRRHVNVSDKLSVGFIV